MRGKEAKEAKETKEREVAKRLLDISTDGRVVRVTLNRPEVRNAFNDELIAEMTAWADSVTALGTARVAVLSGAGKVFCAGADLTWMSKMVAYSRDDNVRDARAMARMYEALDRLPLPLIGRIHGAALGGGAGLAAVCDIVVAAEDAAFAFTEVKLGIIPAVISPYVLAKIGRSAARELFLTGARFSAARAREIGLVHAVAADAELDRVVAKYVNDLLTSGPEAVAAAKGLIADVASRPRASASQYTAEATAERRVSGEGQDGMRAFLEKRLPSWHSSGS